MHLRAWRQLRSSRLDGNSAKEIEHGEGSCSLLLYIRSRRTHGACHAAGASAVVKRVPETVADDVARASHFKLNQAAPVRTVPELEQYDAIVVGTPTRYGRMASQMAAFLDQTGGLWMKGALNGKVGAAFTSTATQHGGQEQALFSVITNLLHLGMVVGLPYNHKGQMSMSEIAGGAPYGATTVAGGDGARQPSEIDLAGTASR